MRLLLIEDNRRLADLIQQVVERSGHAVDVVHDKCRAKLALDHFDYSMIVLDRGLPDGDGLELLRHLRKKDFKSPCLILTARDALRDRVDGLDSGADDYLTKPFANEELVARINALLRRPTEMLGRTIVQGNVTLRLDDHRVDVGGKSLKLSSNELTALEGLMRSTGGCSRRRLEDLVYGMDTAVTPNALEVLMHRVRRHLEHAEATVTIRSIRGFGYALAEHQPA